MEKTAWWQKKTDLKDAFQIIHVNPAEYHLLGFSWDIVVYLDICLPMGARSSRRVFTMGNIVKIQGLCNVTYFRWFFLIDPTDSQSCKNDLTNFLYLCKTFVV